MKLGKRVAEIDGKLVLVDAIPAKQHGQRVPMIGYDNPSSHMHAWPVQRREHGLLEVFCKHGVGHPMPESVAWMDKAYPQAAGTRSIHGCDGCCMRPNTVNPNFDDEPKETTD